MNVVPALVTFVFSLVLTPAIRAGAARVGLVAHPRADRWHRRPTATVGGIAVFVAFWAGMAVFQPEVSRPYPMLFAASLLFAVGLLDDIVQLRPLTKLLAQLAAAGIVVTVGARLQLPWTTWPLVNAAITVVWLVGITNAFNLLDNMDGLAGGIAAIGAIFVTITFVLNGQEPQGELAMILGGAVAGFLVFNVNPASIFMGDCGSMFLGFALAGMSLLSQYGRSRNLGAVVIAPVIILMVPILDTGLVTVTRKIAGRPVSVGGRDHSSHRLVALGNTERRAVVILWSIAAAAGTVALLVRGMSNTVALAVLGGVATVMAIFGAYLARVPLERRPLAPRPGVAADDEHVDAPAGAVRAV